MSSLDAVETEMQRLTISFDLDQDCIAGWRQCFKSETPKARLVTFGAHKLP